MRRLKCHLIFLNDSHRKKGPDFCKKEPVVKYHRVLRRKMGGTRCPPFRIGCGIFVERCRDFHSNPASCGMGIQLLGSQGFESQHRFLEDFLFHVFFQRLNR